MARKFFIGVFAILVSFIVITCLLDSIFDFKNIIIRAFILSAALTTANISLAFFIIIKLKNNDRINFSKIFLGSMAGRFAGLMLVIFMIIKFVNIHRIGFLVSLFLLYFIFQFWEVIIVNKYLDKGKVS